EPPPGAPKSATTPAPTTLARLGPPNETRMPETSPPADLVRNLQSELLRVGCGGNEQEADGNWSPAWQETLRRFNTSAHANLDPDQPSADAVALIHEQKGQVCPSGVAKSKSKSKPAHETEPRKTAARTQERSRREQARRPAESGERRAASAG